MPAVSVLMPCYNAAGTLAEALDSLAQQTLTDYELVAVDDGSTDENSRAAPLMRRPRSAHEGARPPARRDRRRTAGWIGGLPG